MRSALAPNRMALPLLVTAGLLVPTAASAQKSNAEVRLDSLQPATAFSPFTRAEGPRGSWEDGIEFGFRLGMEYLLQPVRATTTGGAVEQDGVETYPVEHALLANVGFALSPLDWMVIDLAMPFALYEAGEDNQVVPSQAVSAGEAGWGDLRIGLGLLAVNGEAFDFMIGTRIWAPFGSTDAYFSGNGHYARWEVLLNAAGKEGSFIYGCQLGIAPLFFGGRDGDSLGASCGGQFEVIPELSLGLEPHFSVYTYSPLVLSATQQPTDESQVPGLDGNSFPMQFEPLAAARLHFGPFAIGVFGGPGIGNAPGMGAVRVGLSATYAAIQEPVVEVPPPPDADVDGIPDERDQCPQEAGTEEKNGCPDERDTDGDGLVDGDACPDQPGARSENPKANGCPDGDNDHVADPIDNCPLEPGGSDDGCPKHARLLGLAEGEPPSFEIKPPIMFERKTAKLSADSVAAIKEIVATMRANPNLKQVSFQVGAKRSGQDLTDKRAGAILTILAEDQDFDSNRYEVVLSEDLEGGAVLVRLVQ